MYYSIQHERAKMPNVYETPAAFNLELMGEVQELRVSEDVYCRNFHIAVWRRPASGRMWYAVESRWGASRPAFQYIEEVAQLLPLVVPSDFDQFKRDLNDYWRGRISSLQPHERLMRNRRNRLQRRVGRALFG
jgi:hypothetical protein